MSDTWPSNKSDHNEWFFDLPRLLKALEDAKDDPWWVMDADLKYINVRIDTRHNAFVIYAEGEKVHPQRVIDAINAFNREYGEKAA